MVVRRIFELARFGVSGQPMGTRSISGWLEDHGYTLRGRPFHHSAIDGILHRPHYRGAYPDKTADDPGRVPEPEDWIWVPWPRIIEPDDAEQVAALGPRPHQPRPRLASPTVGFC